MSNLCPICSYAIENLQFSTQQSVSSDSKSINTPLSHSYCINCSYVFVDFDKRVDYEKFYADNYDFLIDGDTEPMLEDKKYSDHLTNFYSEYIFNNTERSFFDIGAGKGNFLESIHSHFDKLELYALEPSKSFQKLTKKKFLKNTYNTFFDSKQFTRTFDYISLIGVLEHVPKPKDFLFDLKNIMTSRSFLLIEVPNFKNNKSDLLTIDHLSKFTEESLTNLFHTCGYKILKKQISNSVPMQFIIQINEAYSPSPNVASTQNIKDILKKAENYLLSAIHDARALKNKKIAVYGQGLILDYLLSLDILKFSNITCIIDDNILYQGTKYKNKIDIVSFDNFKNDYTTTEVFLAMNDCYHHNVATKLNQYKIYGLHN